MTSGELDLSRFCGYSIKLRRRRWRPPAGWLSAAAFVLAIAFCLAAVPTRADQQSPAQSTAAQIKLFGIAPDEQAAFFQRNRCLAGTVTDIERTSGRLTASIFYPSTNFGPGDLRASVLYSHRIEILESDQPEGKFDGLDLERSALVLAAEPDRKSVYRLVGVVALPQGSRRLQWDFFADKPRFWFNSFDRGG